MSSHIGSFFHSFENGKVKWQGQVLSFNPKQDSYSVQLYEWLMGTPSTVKVIRFAELEKFTFYKTAEEMNEAYGKLTGMERPV